jgi:PBP1b-binding outer membrane lipoprotein LpoB
MKNLIAAATLSFCAFAMTGCMTERTSYVVEDETAEAVAGFSEDDIRTIVLKVIQDINVKSARYSTPEKPVRVVNVKKVKIDTNSRGNDAGYLADTIAQCFKEELTNGGKFYVYNEEAARKAAAAGRPVPYEPQFILESTLRQRNVRRDGGNFYQEFSLNIQLIDVATSMEFWQKRVPLRKAVDKTRVMN